MLTLVSNLKNVTRARMIGSLDADELQDIQFERIFSVVERFGSKDFKSDVS